VRHRRQIFAAWWQKLAAISAITSCTPIAAVHNSGTEQRADPAETSATVPTGAAGAAPTIVTAELASECSEPGARSCARGETRMPVMCSDGKWTAQVSCGMTERCEIIAGPGAGLCAPIATQCLTHEAGEEFCDGELVRTCEDLVLNESRKCRERRRCMEIDGIAECVCATGWVDFGTGAGCERPTNCATDNGGCDTLTQCSVQGTQTICSMCPPGYEGAGKTGCSAQLTDLLVEGGALSPLFSPDNHAYRVSLPLTQQQLRITALAANGVTVDIDNVAQEASTAWQSPPLPLGEHKITINLRTSKDVKSSYELIVTRSGAQEAYLKAEAAESQAEFGMNVAVWGDTVVVGSIYEDGSRENPLDKSTSNSGGAYVFERDANGNWSQQAHLKGDPTRAGDYFGFALAIHEDTLAVSAPGGTLLLSSTPHAGSVHIYKREAGVWTFVQRLSPGIDQGDLFGQALALDGDKLVVGAPTDSTTQSFSGRVYVYPREGDGFGEPATFKANEPVESGLFGMALAVEGDTMVVGAPQFNYVRSWIGAGRAFVFQRNNGQWTQAQELVAPASLEDGATFGWCVDLAGNAVAVGAPRARGADEGQGPGEAFIYERAAPSGTSPASTTATTWTLKQSFRATVPRASDWFGWQMELTESLLLLSAPGDASSSLGLMGDPNLDSAPKSGAIYLYGRNNDQWVGTGFIKSSNSNTPDYFGWAIAMQGDTIVASATGEASDATGVQGNQASNALESAGAAYVFR
jgi:hypothetical protein